MNIVYSNVVQDNKCKKVEKH